MEALLKVNDISMVFGGLRAVSNFSMEIKAGELIGLIGPNGAGKTTAFNMITGVYTPTEGEIMFNGTRTSGKKSYQVTQLGMARTFQNIRLFSELSVIDNVKIAYNMHVKYTLGEAIARVGRYFSEEDEITKKALELLKIFKLEDKAYETAKNLPYGEQRRLEIARALATEPKLLLLDEPAAGMNPQETKELMEMIRWIRTIFSSQKGPMISAIINPCITAKSTAQATNVSKSFFLNAFIALTYTFSRTFLPNIPAGL
jgi:branched-chain amino acid transport system ATP-binding protein